MLVLFLLTFSLFGLNSTASQNARGNELYRAKRYDEALNAYRAAQLKEPESAALHYNIGNALYRQSKYDDAIQQYSKATAGPAPLNARAQYNLGNSLYRMGRLDKAIEAYKRTLRITPNDLDAKYNLEFVRRQMQQPPKPPPQSQDDRQRPPPQDQPPPKQPPPESKQRQPPQKAEQTHQPGDMTREEAERLLDALNQSEKDLQKQRQRQTPARQRPSDKDW